MYLKRIIAHGFKSFADNTVIELNKSIAGVVGPNGSGKSNIVDAIRWVLGEQSVKSLRGDDKMTDVIFSGSKSRKALNTASVTLILDNTDHYLPMDFDEIAIKRRLYRDGTNEFFINNEKVRLKDVSDLLVDSGIAKESFNIIGQGKIEEILSNKATDRRVIFEEASGVLKYKKRKEEALRKLERTHDNMNRVNDIIKELEVQIEPLKEQKHKALEYLSLTDELKDLEVALITSDITNINKTYQENKEKIEILNNEINDIKVNNNDIEVKIEQYKTNINKLDDEIKNKQHELLEKTSEVEKINSQKEIILERKKYELDNNKLHNNLIELKEQELKLQNEINLINLEVTNKQNELNKLTEEKNILVNEINKIKEDKNKQSEMLTEKVRLSESLKTKINTLRESIDANDTLPFAVKNVLNNPKLTGIHNALGSIIEVNEEYSKAISVSLSASANNIIVDNEKCAKDAINYLKANNIGRVTFLPLNIIKGKYVDIETLNIISKQKGFIDVASKLVRYNKIYEDIIGNNLGNVLVVDNIDNANTIHKLINYRYRIVTLDGEVLNVGGSITGGNLKIRNIITDKYELDNMILDLKKNDSNITTLENNINEIDYKLKALEDRLYLKDNDIIVINDFILNKNKNLSTLNDNLKNTNYAINGTDSMIKNTISDEENKIINEYYKALNTKEELQNNINILLNQKQSIANELADFEYTVKKENSLYNEKSEELKKLEIDVNRSDVKLDNLLNILSETYSMTYEYALSNYKLEIDENIARTKVNSLKRKIKELGVVNTLAPEEYDRVSERYEFLIKQQEDLTNAENTLLEIIDEMDKIMEREFAKTFEIINENFKKTVKELFKGGQASLKLTDPDNILETGIEIVACPPGKTLRSISLLSGGEKTFTAISLLFAILKSRPVPFCVLDEVEAALDEVNVESFGEYVKTLNNLTQFIIITHKKKTMEYADILYGITMQESGVSKLVSVKLEDIK